MVSLLTGKTKSNNIKNITKEKKKKKVKKKKKLDTEDAPIWVQMDQYAEVYIPICQGLSE